MSAQGSTEGSPPGSPPGKAYREFKDHYDVWFLPASILAMDNFHPASPLSLGDSKRCDPNKSSILDLPGELRNHIFSYLVESRTLVSVGFVTQHRPSNDMDMRLRFVSRVHPPMDLFTSCRTLYREAGTILYSNNTFRLSRHLPFPFDLPSSFVEVPREFFSRLGSQAHWLRKIVLDLDHLKPRDCFRGEARLDNDFEEQERVFDEKLELFEITPLLRAIWRLEADVDVSFTQPFGPAKYQGEEVFRCHASSITTIMRSILQGQLKLRQYGRLVAAVGLKRDGTGGMINWGTTNYDYRGAHPQLVRILPGPEHMSSFVAEDDGSRLELVKSNEASLLGIPKRIRRTIFDAIINPDDGIAIDLDKETKFNCGLLHTNKEIFETWRSHFLFHNRFTLTMATSDLRTTFQNFDKLRRFLRKTFKSGYSREPMTDESMRTIATSGRDRPVGVDYVLRFNLSTPATLSDIRINILPFVMETSTTPPHHEVTIQIWTPTPDGSTAMTATHTMNLTRLRLNVIKAILDCAFTGISNKSYLPNFWTNGFGDIVETVHDSVDDTGGAWEPASEIALGLTVYHFVRTLHPIDRDYRGCVADPTCEYYDDTQFFPFRADKKEIMVYLMKTMASYPDYFKT
ncbi:uncharacterized protein J4E92_007715 [Alternaria infectoria]|uniref:uncharacterized protein n=1 Tax=Alternaria infectoria TaxID=45303 RepID=UPI00221E4160|nr:uncharacterized protein J4E92_007715 [Alternaria infectoria]KAI4923741.1 hypothetical protein J4E92_007715 [Alternaria infectoria]